MLQLRTLSVVTLIFMLKINVCFGQSLIHYWNFNNLSTGTLAIVASDYTVNPVSSSIEYAGTGDGYMDRVDEGSAVNARRNAPAGYGVRPRNPSNTREFIISASTVGYKSISIQFATTRTNNGATEQRYQYSTDGGTNWVSTGLSVSTFTPQLEPTYSLVTVSLANVPMAEDNLYFQFRIMFGGTAASGTSGNNRFDNISMEGTKLNPDVDTEPPVVSFSPADGAKDISLNTNPILSFNEEVRLLNNSALSNDNAVSLIDLKLDNASGQSIPFTATVTNNKYIKVIPTSPFLKNQQIYVALKPNTIEDLSDNAITTIKSATFKMVLEPTTGVDEIAQLHIKMYPNPNATGKLHFTDAADITVYDVLGNKVLEAGNCRELNIEQLRAGIYSVQLGQYKPLKLIVY